MKKSLFCCVASTMMLMTIVSRGAQADGQINFFTFNSNTSFGQIFEPDNVSPLGPTFFGQIYGSTSSDAGAFFSIGMPVTFGGADGQQLGYVDGGAVSVPGVNPGTTFFYQVRAWDGSFESFDAAVVAGGVLGSSEVRSRVLGGNLEVEGDDPQSFNILNTSNFPSFALVPEPSTMVLGLLGGLGLLWRRRK
jgi:hypothetical protein